MAGTFHQPRSLGLMKSSEEKDWKRQHKLKKSRHKSYDLVWTEDPLQWLDNRNSKVRRLSPPTYSEETLQIDRWYNPSFVGEELRSKGLSVSTQAPDVGLCNWDSKVVNDKGTGFAPFPQSL
eukprot:c17699_g1_i1 orf=2-364(-)